jgi:carotenoid cleavage dioxygenase
VRALTAAGDPACQQKGVGKGNTALAFHAGRLLALHEADLPYALRIACSGLVENLGRVTFGWVGW